MARLFAWVVGIVVVVAGIAGALYSQRTDPIAFVAGRELTGTVVNDPIADWSFAADFATVAIETRPAAPYSVTTWCFVHEGQLYIPASAGSTKTWTHFAASDPRVRVKIGDKIYPGTAVRVTDTSLRDALRDVARAKYDLPAQMPATMGSPSDVWVFRIDPPGPGASS